jgi:hypothetical protein
VIATLIEALKSVSTLPCASRASTTNGSDEPESTVSGDVVTANTANESATAVALNATGDPLSPSTDAAIATAPTVSPSVTVTNEMPSPPVSTVSWLTSASPEVTLHATAWPAIGLPSASVTSTRSGRSSARVTVSVCASPSTSATALGAAAATLNTAVSVSASPAAVRRRR